MSSLRSSVFLRNQICDTLGEMAALNSTTLPDGATVYQNDSNTLWRLDKTAGTVYDAMLGSGLLLKPDDGSSARWFADVVNGSSPYYNSSYLVGTVAVVMSASQWAYLGSTAGTFALNAGDAAAFTVSPTTGQVTYNGPQRDFLVTATISLLNGAAANSINIRGCISRNNDVVVGTTTDYSVKGEAAMVTADVTAQLSVERIVRLSPGTTLRLALRNATNSDDLSVSLYQLCIAPL